jgi:hypothetical protein
VDGFGESAGVSHGEATLGGSGSYVNMDAIVYLKRRRCIIAVFAFDKDRVLV